MKFAPHLTMRDQTEMDRRNEEKKTKNYAAGLGDQHRIQTGLWISKAD